MNLIGSEKQIKWANDIMKDAEKKFDIEFKMMVKNFRKKEELTSLLKKHIFSNVSSKYWIDTKDTHGTQRRVKEACNQIGVNPSDYR